MNRAPPRPTQTARTPGPREVLAGRYRVSDVRDDGALLALDLTRGDEVVVAVLDAARAAVPGNVEAFLRAGRAAMALQSPHVVPVLDVGTLSDGRPYRATARLRARDVASYVASAAEITVPEIVELAKQICGALAEAHAAGLTHGRLGPRAVQIPDAERVAKVVDLGLEIPDAGISQAEAIAADVRALGVLLRGLLAGRTDVPPSLEQILATCAETRPGEGFEDALDLSLSLGAIDHPTGVFHAPAGFDDPTVRMDSQADETVRDAPRDAPAPAPAPPPPKTAPLRRIGDYVIAGPLARGGMASVFYGCARDASGAVHPVALKRMRTELADEHFATMLADEARIAARIRHPNVVGTFGVVVDDDDEPIVVFEYVAGISLAQLLRRLESQGKAVPVHVAASLAVQVLHGLHAAHEAVDEGGRPLEVVHRDVTPANVLLDERGQAKIADFGIAQARGRLQRTTATGAMKGKLGYLAPEQVHGKATRASDVYAVGVVLWEMLAGRELFTGTDGEILAASLLGNVPAPSANGRPEAAALDAVVLRAIDRDPTRRFASAQVMADAIMRTVELASPAEIAAFVEATAPDELEARRAAVATMVADVEVLDLFAQPRPERSAPADFATKTVRVDSLSLSTTRKAPLSPPTPMVPGAAPMPVPLATPMAPPTAAPLTPVAAVTTPAMPAPERPRRSGVLVGLVVLLLVLASGVAASALRSRAPAPASEDVMPADPTSSPIAPGAPTAGAEPSAPSPAAPAPSPPPSAASTPAPAPTRSAAPLPRTGARPAPSTPRKGDPCSPPYHVTANGRRVWKRECFPP